MINYRTRASAGFVNLQPVGFGASVCPRPSIENPQNLISSILQGATCHAVEVLSDYVVVVQLSSVDIFKFPQSLRDDHDVSSSLIDGVIPVADGELMVSYKQPRGTAMWVSASIVPYTRPFPFPSPTTPSSTAHQRPISILIRERIASYQHKIIHSVIPLPPHELSEVLHAPILPVMQTRLGVRAHFFHDLVVSPSNGRGFWVENTTAASDPQSNEILMLFSTGDERLFADVSSGKVMKPTTGGAGPLIDIGGALEDNAEAGDWFENDGTISRDSASIDVSHIPGAFPLDSPRHSRDSASSDPARTGSVRRFLRHMPHITRSCSYCSFDDSVGRIVIATHDGKVRIVDVGSD